MELELIDSEVSAGNFSADIVAKDIATNKNVIIENQFGNTDHRHLGQLLTCAAILNANAIVWIAETIRIEHKTAIDFLNNNLKESLFFYAVEVSVIQIDDSKPAYVFNTISKPSIKDSIPTKSGEISENKERYRSFFQSLIDVLRDEHKFTNAKVGQPQNWYTFSSDNSKTYKYSISFALGNRIRAEVYIDTGDKERNENLFENLILQKKDIEKQFDNKFEWEKLETKRACRIAIYKDGSIDDESEYLETVKDWSITCLLKMKNILPKYIQEWLNNEGKPPRKNT